MSMNKIILLGHPTSGLHQVESLLLASGMQAALPSKRDDLLPSEVVDTLCQAHQCPSVDNVMTEDEFIPVQAGPMWHGLALDLVMGNLQQALWGWADARNVFWLDYWATLDPHATFVMVYDHPISALQAAAGQLVGRDIDMEIPRLLENWQAYNGAMLRFYSRHAGRCLLINARHAHKQLLNYVGQLGERLHGATPHLLTHNPQSALAEALLLVLPAEFDKQALHWAITQGQGNPDTLRQWLSGDNPLERHLLQKVLEDYPAAEQIYQELEAAATVQQSQPASASVNHGDAWMALVEQRQTMAALTVNLYEQFLEQKQLQLGLNERISIENKRAEIFRKELAEAVGRVQNLEKENEETKIKLNKTLEDREKKLIENQDLSKAKNEALAKVQAFQQQLKQSKKPTLDAPKIKELEEENDLILSQLHQVQEELERYYLENQDLKKKLPQPQTKPYGAAQRIQKRLSYRLGSVMIANSRSLRGWLGMPFALAGQVRSYRKEKQAEGDRKLPPIHTYADAHDAERYKQHLSYRLGEIFIKQSKTPWGWLILPFALRSAVKAFKEGRA
jgi:hypothetical protein